MTPAQHLHQQAQRPSRRERIHGCLLGGAIGDALGAPVEFMSGPQVADRFPHGVHEYLPTQYGHGLGLITDDTQMTLFTIEALLACESDSTIVPIVTLHQAYLDWLLTQRQPGPSTASHNLSGQAWLYSPRAPGNTCMSALSAADGQASGLPASNNSKGCGAVMRSAPFALVPLADGPKLAVEAAALTHGHESGQVSSGAFVVMLQEILAGASLDRSVDLAIDWCATQVGGDETLAALERARGLANTGAAPTQLEVESLGGGWVGEEALAIAVYCALVYPGHDEVLDALSLAVTHGGDSDSTGELCGHLLGALHGESALPPSLIAIVEGAETIRALADDACRTWERRPQN